MKRHLIPAIAFAVAVCVLLACSAILAPTAREKEQETLDWLCSQILPGGENFTQEAYSGEDENIVAVFKADEGFVIQTRVQGYADDIVALVGVNTDGTISGLVVQEMQETLGLGMQALSSVEFLSQFLFAGTSFTVGENVDALTGATVTSKAIAKAVNSASAYVTGADVDSGATQWGG